MYKRHGLWSDKACAWMIFALVSLAMFSVAAGHMVSWPTAFEAATFFGYAPMMFLRHFSNQSKDKSEMNRKQR